MTNIVTPDAAAGAHPDPDRGLIQSIDRAAQVLALFDQDTSSLSAATVADRLGLNRTTAHRYLLSLQAAGFLNSSNSLGPLVDQLAAVVSGHRRILALAPAILRSLSDRTEMTAVLSLLGRTGPVVALVEEAATGSMILTVRVGTVLEQKASQTRVLLAFQSDPRVVARYLGQLSKAALLEEELALAKVRRERVGWADLRDRGLAAVSAPVFGNRDVQAAIAILSTEKLLPPSEQSTEVVTALRDAADELSRLVDT